MSIEHNVSTGAPKATQSAAGHGAAKKSPATADTGGFAALLMSLGAEELPVDTALTGETTEDLSTLPGTEARDPAALPEADAVQVAAQVPVLPAPPLAKSAEAIIVNPSATATSTGAVVQGLAAGRSEAPVWQSQAEVSRETVVDPGLPVADKEQAVAEVQPLLRQAGLAQRLAQQRSQAADASQAAQVKRGEDIAARLGWQISETPGATGLANPALLAAGLGEAGRRPYTERNADKYGARGVGEAGVFAGVGQAEGARLDVPAVAPDGGLTTEMRVAEQVSYYVGRGAQSAELEVEGIDERPIHISIDLQGQDARIEFRAEQAQTRQVLQDAMPHLREMLEREGLTLAGMSVGHSGPQGGQEQSGQGRSGGRQARVVAEVEGPVAAANAARTALPPGRSVDLFV